jgi:prepilin-type N-terminal cleavage/methylation domain-containing protein
MPILKKKKKSYDRFEDRADRPWARIGMSGRRGGALGLGLDRDTGMSKNVGTLRGRVAVGRSRAYTLLELIVAIFLLGIAALCVAQFTLSMSRYTTDRLRRMQAYTLAMSYFEQILYQYLPSEFAANIPVPPTTELLLPPLDNPSASGSVPLTYNLQDSFDETHPFFASVLHPNDLRVEFDLQVRNNPLDNPNAANIAPLPEGFQSIHLKYRWASAEDPSVELKWDTDHLYALRPIESNDPV